MSQPTIDDVRRMARETFGREITDAEAELYREHIPGLVNTVGVIDAWAGKIGDCEPATVSRGLVGLGKPDGGA